MKSSGQKEGGGQTDWISHPPHYEGRFLECIDFIRYAADRTSGIDAYCLGTVIKYLWRCPMKGGAEDLRKAEWYLLFWQRRGHFLFSETESDRTTEEAMRREMRSRFDSRETGEVLGALLEQTASVRCREDIPALISRIRDAAGILP